MKRNNKNFVIFPLNILSLKVSYNFLIKCIIDYYTIFKLKDKYKEELMEYLLFDDMGKSNIHEWEDFVFNVAEIQKTIRKENDLEDAKIIFLRYKILAKHNDKFTKRVKGKDATVLLYIDLLRDIIYKNALKERQFRILCGIYSKIGSSEYPQPVYNDEIRIRAFGYRKKGIGNPHLLYSDKILRKEIRLLKYGKYSRGFFDRSYDGRRFYYSRVKRGQDLDNYVQYKLSLNKARRDEEMTRYNKIRDNIKNEQITIDKLTVAKKVKSKKHFHYSDIIKTANSLIKKANLKYTEKEKLQTEIAILKKEYMASLKRF